MLPTKGTRVRERTVKGQLTGRTKRAAGMFEPPAAGRAAVPRVQRGRGGGLAVVVPEERRRLAAAQRCCGRVTDEKAMEFGRACIRLISEKTEASIAVSYLPHVVRKAVVLVNLEAADKLGVASLPSILLFASVGRAGGGFLGSLSPVNGASA